MPSGGSSFGDFYENQLAKFNYAVGLRYAVKKYWYVGKMCTSNRTVWRATCPLRSGAPGCPCCKMQWWIKTEWAVCFRIRHAAFGC